MLARSPTLGQGSSVKHLLEGKGAPQGKRSAHQTVERAATGEPGLSLACARCRHPGAPGAASPGSAFSTCPPEAAVTQVRTWETPGSRSSLHMGTTAPTRVRLLLRGRARGRYPVNLAIEPDFPFASKTSRGAEAAS